MPLSMDDQDDAIRFAGYPTQASLQFCDADTQGYYTQLTIILAGLTDNQVTILQSQYLTSLRTLEAAIVAAGNNLDTDKAAVWTHNRTEVQDRDNLFMITRRRMCFFLGIPSGAGITPLTPWPMTT